MDVANFFRQGTLAQNIACRIVGRVGFVGVVFLFAPMIPFIGYYAMVLDTVTTVGFDVTRYKRLNMVSNVDATGVFFCQSLH